MAKKTVLISDLTGAEIPNGDGAQVTIKFTDARKGQIVLDVLATEVAEMAAKGLKQSRRGRKPKENGVNGGTDAQPAGATA